MSLSLGVLKTIAQTNAKNTATVIFLHGSGDTGPGVCEWIESLVGSFSFPNIKFLFPTAPLQSYTAAGGEMRHVWFDRKSISIEAEESVESIDEIGSVINNLIEEEVSSGIPLNKIIVGGFSMGGGLALHVGYRLRLGLRGVFALSSFLNRDSQVFYNLKTHSTADTPLLMYHGERDSLVPIKWGRATYDTLESLGVGGDFVSLPNTIHELKKRELEELFEWIKKLL
ncbi:hypothetical protein PPYR_07747 [Photinus pyralis]|uniref:palmitoyl-protein hydrolase n=2 Tax=Photinus pyralis TaxID=7054 RepID=A0A5N4ARB1_PHOPY|nr:lysophospholipase-like protein 1 [Photinus pyralis]KAB0799867.1 hypothetical protein PPYR_07747 [Photinus pyralis]